MASACPLPGKFCSIYTSSAPAGGWCFLPRDANGGRHLQAKRKWPLLFPFPILRKLYLCLYPYVVLSSHGLTPLTKPKHPPVLMESLSDTHQSFLALADLVMLAASVRAAKPKITSIFVHSSSIRTSIFSGAKKQLVSRSSTTTTIQRMTSLDAARRLSDYENWPWTIRNRSQ